METRLVWGLVYKQCSILNKKPGLYLPVDARPVLDMKRTSKVFIHLVLTAKLHPRQEREGFKYRFGVEGLFLISTEAEAAMGQHEDDADLCVKSLRP